MLIENQSEMKVLLIYNESTDLINNMIANKITADLYSIDSKQALYINNYDLILIGTTTNDNQVSSQMSQFLSNYDFQGKYVSNYWVGTLDNDAYETDICRYIKNANILPGIGFTGDEISEVALVSQLLDGWLTSINQPNLI